jgi:hypothetical protein
VGVREWIASGLSPQNLQARPRPAQTLLLTAALAAFVAISGPAAFGLTTHRAHIPNNTGHDANDFHIEFGQAATGGAHARPFADSGQLGKKHDFSGTTIPAKDGGVDVEWVNAFAEDIITEAYWTLDTKPIGEVDLTRVRISNSNAPTRLEIHVDAGGAHLSWPTNDQGSSLQGFGLQATPSLTSPQWRLVTEPTAIVGDQFVVTEPVAYPMMFYRLVNMNPPALVAVTPDTAGDRITLEFSEPVDALSATDLLNYYLADSLFDQIFPLSAILSTPDSVDLIVNPPLLPGDTYYLGVQGVQSLPGFVMAPVTLLFTNPVPDTTPPTLVAVTALAGTNRITLTFSEPVDEQGATDFLNYYLSSSQLNQVIPLQPTLATPDSVDLILASPLVPGDRLVLGAQGVQDLAGNLMNPVTVQFAAFVPQVPCPGGTLLVQQAYSECNPDGFWHVVEDDWYRCPDGSTQKFRVADTKTTQPCGTATGQTAPSPVGLLYPTEADVASTCQSPVYIGQLLVRECLGGLWSISTYLKYQCLDGTIYLSGPVQNVPMNPPTPCNQPPPPMPRP